MKRTKWLAALMAVVLSASLFTGCGAKEKTKVNVAALNGPTGGRGLVLYAGRRAG